ncbi:hypothetical protein PHSY_000276 [Pseudozyma hubeiensis SY62]|uniref:Uncharacterized protein n=1 Tax=Pseudozyma hubeiensis (strain SY62) TaxID=1305764 RepID=R9NW77_PSEHS|nr:hypothetical protein PHSY_000276 [Pseudozyma hubeiensis SY62]GAC92721.1 hypothetical protein PHSY_000276 [Pseudozyma hubeiensis SY62]
MQRGPSGLAAHRLRYHSSQKVEDLYEPLRKPQQVIARDHNLNSAIPWVSHKRASRIFTVPNGLKPLRTPTWCQAGVLVLISAVTF